MIVVILAGGQGRRHGGNKALAPWDDTTLIGAVIARMAPQADRLAINARGDLARPLSAFGLPILIDDVDFSELGPLCGVRTAMKWASAAGDSHVVTAPCDMPDLPVDMVARLMAADAADIVHFAGARDHPLCTRWSVSLLTALEDALAQADGGLAVMRFVSQQQVITLPTVDDAAFANINAL
ncbi:MAG: NTP transferase domain-containing protein [Asticcacaulis sp.]|nr:NTP transferase domain-containing protein [Asticcacaulis sp.]